MIINKSLAALRRAFDSPWLFRAGVIWFAAQASWLSCTGLFPMVFDERHHFEMTRMYSDKLLPFWNHVPDGSSTYGAITRDPSYLYHYLLSFPMRFIEMFVGSPIGQIISLRTINIAMFIVGIILFRKVLRHAGLTHAMSNVVMVLFCTLPATSLLAAQINYDNLLFMLIPACLLYLEKCLESLRNTRRLDVINVLLLAITCMAAALTKYAFLPVLLAISIVLIAAILRYTDNWKQRLEDARSSFAAINPKLKIVLVGVFFVLFGFSFERYGINTIKYGSPAPECDQVLSINECMNFEPWRRNYQTRQSKLSGELEKRDTNFEVFFMDSWFSKSNYQLFFTMDGQVGRYTPGRPFPLLHRMYLRLAALGAVLFVTEYWFIRRQKKLGILLFIAGTYVAVLIIQNYTEFLHLGYPFGIQGRYLVPFLPIAGAALATGYGQWLRRLPSTKTILATVVIIFSLTQGGGATTYILRSDPSWYWTNVQVVKANDFARKLLRPFILKDQL